MKKILSLLAFLLPLPVSAQDVVFFGQYSSAPFTCDGQTKFASYGDSTLVALQVCDGTSWKTVTTGSGTTNTVPKFTPNGTTLGNSAITDDGTVVTVNGATTMRAVEVPGSGFLNVAGTLPSADGIGVSAFITSAGSGAISQVAQRAWLLAGYTGTKFTVGLQAVNFAAGTGATEWGPSVGNYAINATTSSATTGINVGAQLRGGGSSTRSYGSILVANELGDSTGDIVGSLSFGQASSGTNIVGAAAVIRSGLAVPAYTTTAFLADNMNVAAPIAIFRDNGTPVLTVGDSTAVTGATTIFGHAASDGTAGFLNVTGTLPTGTSSGSRFTITSNAASTSTSIGLFSALLAGSTANSYSAAGYFSNGVNPSGTAPTYGIYSVASGSSATKIGIQADAVSGTTSSTGILGTANSASGYQIGGDFRAYGAGTKVGIHASLTSATAVTAVDTAALFDNAAVAASIAIFRDNGVETVAIEDGAAVSTTRGFLNVTGTLPTTGFPGGAFFNITTAGTANSQNGIEVLLKPGFTGSGKTMAGYFENTVLGTSTDIGNANVSVYSNTIGVGAGFGTGTSSQSSGSTVWNTGSYNQGGTGTGTTGLGGYFVGAGATNSIGLLATIGTGAQLQPALSAVAVLDNAAIAAPIALFRDNSVTKVSIEDGGKLLLASGNYIEGTEAAAPGAPAAGQVILYAKSGTPGEFCSKDDANVEVCMSAGSGGSGLTHPQVLTRASYGGF